MDVSRGFDLTPALTGTPAEQQSWDAMLVEIDLFEGILGARKTLGADGRPDYAFLVTGHTIFGAAMVPGRCQDFRGLRWGETQVHIRPADRALPEVAKIFVKFFGSRVVPWDAVSETPKSPHSPATRAAALAGAYKSTWTEHDRKLEAEYERRLVKWEHMKSLAIGAGAPAGLPKKPRPPEHMIERKPSSPAWRWVLRSKGKRMREAMDRVEKLTMDNPSWEEPLSRGR